ncbi:hypothetical protein [Kibdelosporangium aridum]|uniref:hypothetical protein n=1 Tax=Kibdelosporangium aridum TaxID=2030 RepID=UPI001358A50C|nr:hypothetical protein [Kibdelosporangium aridum]
MKAILRLVQLTVRTRHVPPRSLVTSSENCQECARRWQQSGYDPAARCPKHPIGY